MKEGKRMKRLWQRRKWLKIIYYLILLKKVNDIDPTILNIDN